MVTYKLGFLNVPVGCINRAFYKKCLNILPDKKVANEVTVRQAFTVEKNVFKQSLWQMFDEVQSN